jgi:DNA-binding NtrC family response regulator
MGKARVSFPVLLVDDEEEILFSTGTMFRMEGFDNILTESDSRKVMAILEEREVSLILLDLNMPFVSGYDLLKAITASHPDVPVIIMTAANELELAVECMKSGAFDYFVKPAEKNRLLASIRRALELHNLRNEVSMLTRELLSDRSQHDRAFAPIVTRSPKMRSIFSYLSAVAATDQPVLITGETGVGKELVARSLHVASGRKGAFVAVNIGGLDDQNFSDTLFGHSKGAFTGADQLREGLVAKAAGGTLFLDEIGDMTLSSQIKLLRLLQEHEYYPLGSDLLKRCDARIVVATNKDLQEMMAGNGFRKDLYFRLKSHHVTIPPLRERLEDIPLLLEYFLEQAAEELNKARPSYPPQLPDYLASCAFPGNVREFKAAVLDAVACHQKGMLSLAGFQDLIVNRTTSDNSDPLRFVEELDGVSGNGSMPTLKDAEEALISHALSLANNNQGIAASYLGITRQALNKRLTRKGQ